MEGQTVTLQDVFVFDYAAGVDAERPLPAAQPIPTGVRPRFTDKFDRTRHLSVAPRLRGPRAQQGLR